MKTIFVNILISLVSVSLFAQGNNLSQTNEVLSGIEENNTTLKALRRAVDAQKLENKTGIFLANPQIDLAYLWGSPNGIGNRTNIDIKQTFDIPTITGAKNKVANEQNNLIELQYKASRMNILLEAKQYCFEMIYYNALIQELNTRLTHAKTIAATYKKRLDEGDVNIIEYNKVQLNLSSVLGEISRVEVERNALLSQLKRLNGGADLELNDYQYDHIVIPVSFDEWFAQSAQKSPILAYVSQEVEVSKRQLSLSKAMDLPSFSAGYMSEKVVGQQYQGITFGLSIPLWENKNRVKQAKALVRAAEIRQIDGMQQFYNQLQTLYNRASGLRDVAENYRKALVATNNTDLLKKALDAGEISLLDYIVEVGLYYNTINQMLEAERDYQKAFAELSAMEL